MLSPRRRSNGSVDIERGWLGARGIGMAASDERGATSDERRVTAQRARPGGQLKPRTVRRFLTVGFTSAGPLQRLLVALRSSLHAWHGHRFRGVSKARPILD